MEEAERRRAHEKEQKSEKTKGGFGGLKDFLNQMNNATKLEANDNAPSHVSRENDTVDAEPAGWAMKSPLMHVRGFLEALIMDNKDGRIVVKTPLVDNFKKDSSTRLSAAGDKAALSSTSSSISASATGAASSPSAGTSDASLRFLLLNPSNVFTDVIQDVRRLE